MAHRIADLLKAGVAPLRDEFLAAPVKHADETTWSCDGRRGCQWVAHVRGSFLAPDVRNPHEGDGYAWGRGREGPHTNRWRKTRGGSKP